MKTKKIEELENVVSKLQQLSTESLEKEILYLEHRKIDLLNELEATEAALVDRKSKLSSAQRSVHDIVGKLNMAHEVVSQIVSSSPHVTPTNKKTSIETDTNSINYKDDNMNNKTPSMKTNSQITTHLNTSARATSPDQRKAITLEEDCQEETEVFISIKEKVDELLFIIHRNDIDEIFIYTNNKDQSGVAKVSKIMNMNKPGELFPLDAYELTYSYDVKVVPNHDREYPNVKEISNKDYGKGYLVGSYEIPILPNVLFDVWREDNDGNTHCWATTSIDNIPFAIIERIFLSTDNDTKIKNGTACVTQVDLYGRHPVKGYLLVESITAAIDDS